MRQTVFLLGIIAVLLSASLALMGQSVFPQIKKRSILGDKRDSIFSEFSSTAAVSSPAQEDSPNASPAYDLLVPTTTAAGIAGEEFLEFLGEKKFISYSRERWQKMRAALEDGRIPGQEEVAVSSTAQPSVPVLPPGLSIELPYESQLSISGRKLIGVAFKTTVYDKPDPLKRINSSSFDMTQELQVRIKGRVGRKINVNVDFDDTSQDKRDISVVYKGDPEELVQDAAFGDITMTLPSTEFVGYSRQLFGVKVHTKYKNLKSWGFFSRTKGFSEIKRFTGNTKFERRTISDISYIGLKYYELKFNSDSIKSGTVKVYQDDRNLNNNNINTSTGTIVETLTSPATSYTGDFDLLVPGQDYTVDYNKGIIIFRNKVGTNYVLAVDYQKTDDTWLSDTGTPGKAKIIKDELNTASVSRELKTFYSLGNLKIIRDNGRGNFILKVQDLNGTVPSSIEPGAKAVPSYPANINVDFESGVFNFEPPTGKPFPDDLYTYNTHRYNLLTEYRYRIKFINLRPGIVPQSERVSMDGKVLKADEDYFVDYDAGIVTFFSEDKINENTVIEVSYDYAPFGGTGGSTLVGLRSELSLTDNIFVGSSFIYDFAAKTLTIPDIRTTPSSLGVWEADSKIQNIKLPFMPLTLSLSGEYATSQQNSNIMNKAIIESMEGVKQEDMASVYYESWKGASNPSGVKYYANRISWGNEEVLRKEINPSLNITTEEKQQVLDVSYDLGQSQEVSIVQSLSNIGADYSKKLYLETWIYGDNQGEELLIGYGSFNEDADSDGKLDTEDINHDGTLNAGEDIGWEFNNPDGSITRIGAGNGKIDTEDLDGNGILSTIDNSPFPNPYGFGSGKTAVDSAGVTYSAVTWSGWKLFKIPLKISTPDEWKNIKQVRLTVKGSGNQKGTIKIAGLSLVGNKWEQAGVSVAGSTLTISGIDTETNPDYAKNSLLNNDDYLGFYDIVKSDVDLTEKKEQALSLQYEISDSTAAELAARLPYGRAYDLSNYQYLKLFVYNKSGSADDVFFIQAGNDTNYYEYSTSLDWGANWKLITIRQTDMNKDGKPDRWVAGDGKGSTTIVGSPSMQNISQIKIGVRSKGPKLAEIWVNEIHVTDTLQKEGFAWRGNADFNWPGWSAFGIKRKEHTRDFQTFSAGVYNRDYLEDSAYLNLTKLSFLPVNTSMNRTLTITPSVVQNQSDLVSILEEGRVVTYSGTGSSNFSFGALPRIGAQFSRTITDSQQIQRLEDKETYSGTLDYANPISLSILPRSFSGNYSLTNSFFRKWQKIDNTLTDSQNFLGIEGLKEYLKLEDYHTLEITETIGAKTPFQFWNGFTFNPSVNLNTVREKNNNFVPQIEYLKSKTEDVSASSTLQIFNWLQPNFSYSANIRENYNITYSTNAPIVLPSKTKYIERSSNGEITWNFQVKDFINQKYTQSLGLSSSYRIQDSDSYENVDGKFEVIGFDKLWIRNSPLLEIPLSGSATSYTIKSIIKKDDVRVAGRYNPFEAFDIYGRLSPLKTLSANFTYTWNEEHSIITGTQRDAFTKIWPDLIFGLSQVEKIFSAEKWLSDSQLNLKHQSKVSETIKISHSESKSYGSDFRANLLKKIDLNLGINTSQSHDLDLVTRRITQEGENISWSSQGGFYVKKWRFTVRYENAQDWKRDGTGKLTSDLLTQTYTGQVNCDMSFPRGLPIPFMNRTLPLTNRLIMNSTVKFAQKSSALNVERDNTNDYGLSASAEYEVSSNFRLSFGLGWTRTENRVKSDESYSTIDASSRLTIQF